MNDFCGLDWCTVDHSEPHDDWDGDGRFLWSDTQTWVAPDETDQEKAHIWSRGNALWARMVCWSPVNDVDEVRLDLCDHAAVTPGELREIFAWCLSQAELLEIVQRQMQEATI